LTTPTTGTLRGFGSSRRRSLVSRGYFHPSR
jgi:hypothetical protein